MQILIFMKVTYSSDKVNPFGGICFIDKLISSSGVSRLIDEHLGTRGLAAEYSYSDIIKSMWYITLCGGNCAEDINENLKDALSLVKDTKISSADTVLRVEKELATEKEEHISDSGISHEFNINMPLNDLMVKILVHLGMIRKTNKNLTFDYDNQFIPTEKYDSKKSYKHSDGYFPGIATINNMPVYIENRNGNSNVKYKQEETLERAYSLLTKYDIKVKRSRMDCGSFTEAVIEVIAQNSELYYVRAQRCDYLTEQIRQITDWEEVIIGYKKYQIASIDYAPFGGSKTYRYVISREAIKNGQMDCFTQDAFTYRAILTNDYEMSCLEVIEFYNKRGDSERVFDIMNNDFNWNHLPFSFLHENTVYMIIMAICKNVYQFLIEFISKRVDFIKPHFRLKKFIFRFVTVPAKRISRGRQQILKLFSTKPYHLVIQ